MFKEEKQGLGGVTSHQWWPPHTKHSPVYYNSLWRPDDALGDTDFPDTLNNTLWGPDRPHRDEKEVCLFKMMALHSSLWWLPHMRLNLEFPSAKICQKLVAPGTGGQIKAQTNNLVSRTLLKRHPSSYSLHYKSKEPKKDKIAFLPDILILQWLDVSILV